MTEKLQESCRQRMTDSILLRRLGNTVELAGMLVMLASEPGNVVTGQSFTIDGGQAIG